MGAQVPVGEQPEQRGRRTGNASSTSTEVKSMFQVKIGIRNIVMPGPRRHTIVVIMLTAPSTVDSPPMISPAVHRSPPAVGE